MVGNLKNDANMVYVQDNDSEFVMATIVEEDQLDRGVIDSACSHHICPNMESFTKLNILKGGAIYMGNREKMGVGDIRLKLHGGTIKKLTNVWYVPDLKLNLISLSALESDAHPSAWQTRTEYLRPRPNDRGAGRI